MDISNIEPKEVMKFFGAICAIPHGSGNEKQLSDYIVQFAKDRGLWVRQDEFYNVLVKKKASPGYESAPAVIVQSHLDMVCEQNKATGHDFKKDGLRLKVEEDFLQADGTTLGADDGIGVAMMLAVLDGKDMVHPPIEAVFTTDEEVGMEGAKAFDTSDLKGKYLLNLDTEKEGVFVAGCCGGAKVTIHLPIVRKKVPQGYFCARIMVRGLKGGHSGGDIHLQRANASKLMGRILFHICRVYDCRVVQIDGGLMDNAIARECETVLFVKDGLQEELKKSIQDLEAVLKAEYDASDKGLEIIFEEHPVVADEAFSDESLKKAIAVLCNIPYGVMFMSAHIKGLVETSSNIGITKTLENEMLFTSAVRSNVASRKQALVEEISILCDLVGGRLEIRGEYPAWEYKAVSPIRDMMVDLYKEKYGKEPIISAVHAGLECGLFSMSLPDVDMISFGPEMYGAHSPQERLYLPSAKRCWEFFKDVLKKLAEKK